jgi:4-oxalocrotonate tautomerase
LSITQTTLARHLCIEQKKIFMPYIKIQVTREGVTKEQKASLIRGATELLQKVLNKDPQTTFVIIEEVDTDNWGVAGEQVTERRKKALQNKSN